MSIVATRVTPCMTQSDPMTVRPVEVVSRDRTALLKAALRSETLFELRRRL